LKRDAKSDILNRLGGDPNWRKAFLKHRRKMMRNEERLRMEY